MRLEQLKDIEYFPEVGVLVFVADRGLEVRSNQLSWIFAQIQQLATKVAQADGSSWVLWDHLSEYIWNYSFVEFNFVGFDPVAKDSEQNKAGLGRGIDFAERKLGLLALDEPCD